MNLKDLRPISFTTLRDPVMRRQRKIRMAAFLERIGVDGRKRILDLGGLPGIWESVEQPQHITFLNLPGAGRHEKPTHHHARFVEGDGCQVDAYGDGEFDIVFSNSVIEHVGPEERQQAFANEVRRLGKAYWVQTPAMAFPIEAHCGMPFWWYYPDSMREYFIERWRPKLPSWTQMVEETRVLTKERMQALFPDAQIYTEHLFGIPKSYAAYRPA